MTTNQPTEKEFYIFLIESVFNEGCEQFEIQTLNEDEKSIALGEGPVIQCRGKYQGQRYGAQFPIDELHRMYVNGNIRERLTKIRNDNWFKLP